MVNTLSHIGVGLLLSYALGIKGKKRLVLIFLSLLPDLDYFTYSIFTLISGSVSHEIRNQLFYLLGHREFTHTIFFAFLIALFIWVKTKDKTFAMGSFQAVFLHSLLDYTTSSKMRLFYPLSTEPSALRAIYSLDPVLNFLPLLPLIIVAADYIKNFNALNLQTAGGAFNVLNNSLVSNNWKRRSRNWAFNSNLEKIWSRKNQDSWNRNLKGFNKKFGNGRFDWLNQFHNYVNGNERKLYASLILVLLIWITLFPLAKIFLINHISENEGTRINYKNTYPISPGKFLAAYSYDDSRYKLLKVSYWKGIDESFYVDKISVSGNVSDAQAYVKRTETLYSSSVPQAIDYPVYAVSEEKGYVTVILSDARNPYVDKWPYFDTVYRFVFDKKTGEYVVYESHYGRSEKKLDKNYFE
jgi:inner membrane protein